MFSAVSSFWVTRVSSARITSQPSSVSRTRGLTSERLPMGVPTTYKQAMPSSDHFLPSIT